MNFAIALHLDRIKSDLFFQPLPWATNRTDGEEVFVCTAEGAWLGFSSGNKTYPLIFKLGSGWSGPRWSRSSPSSFVFSQTLGSSRVSFSAPCRVSFPRSGVFVCRAPLGSVSASLWV